MKKTMILLATAFVACVACNKEVDTPSVSEGFTITASIEQSKATVDGLQVEWTTGDQIALFQTAGDPVPFTLEGEGPVTTGTFKSTAASVSPNGVAAFPAEGATFSGTKVTVDIPAEFAYGTTPIPMVGTASASTAYDFAVACGAVNLVVKDIPPYPCSLIVTADKNITGTLEIPDYSKPTEAAFAEAGAGKTFTVTDIPRGNINITLPIPAGTYSLDVKLVAADGKTVVPRTGKTISNLTIEAKKIARMKTIDIEFGNPPAEPTQTAAGTFNVTTLPGKWNVLGDNSTKNGIYVLGGGGGYGSGWAYPALVCPYAKTWDWDDSCYRESDNELVVKVTGMTASQVTGTMNWWAGADGKFWNYIWKYSGAAQYAPFVGTDLSAYYDRIPKGENAFTIDLSSMTATLANGETPKILLAGTYTFCGGVRTRTIPDGMFALMFHIGNMKPVNTNPDWLNDGSPRDIDRFLFSPLEYIIIFERTGDLS